MQEHVEDGWGWSIDSSGVYFVVSAYNCLTSDELITSDLLFKKNWVKRTPLKMVVFAWRVALNRIPTVQNLIRRGVIQV